MGGWVEASPEVPVCCGLRAGTVLCALAGLGVGGTLLAAYCVAPLDEALSRSAFGVGGVALCWTHALLLVALHAHSTPLCADYVWSVTVVCGALAVVTAATAARGLLQGAVLLPSLGLLAAALGLAGGLYSALLVANYRMTLP